MLQNRKFSKEKSCALDVPCGRGENFEISALRNLNFSKERSCILIVPRERSERVESFEISMVHNWKFPRKNHVYWMFPVTEEKILRFQGFLIESFIKEKSCILEEIIDSYI